MSPIGSRLKGWPIIWKDLWLYRAETTGIYVVPIRSSVPLHQVNIYKCTHILLNHYFINTRACTVLRYLTQYTPHTKFNFTTGDSLCWPSLLKCTNYTPWRWPFKSWNVLEFCIVLIRWLFNNIYICFIYITYLIIYECIWRCLFNMSCRKLVSINNDHFHYTNNWSL